MQACMSLLMCFIAYSLRSNSPALQARTQVAACRSITGCRFDMAVQPQIEQGLRLQNWTKPSTLRTNTVHGNDYSICAMRRTLRYPRQRFIPSPDHDLP